MQAGTKHAGRIDQLLRLTANDDAILKRCFDLLIDLLHPLDRDDIRGIRHLGSVKRCHWRQQQSSEDE